MFDIPRLHAGEQRRILEGQRVAAALRDEQRDHQRTEGESPGETRRRELKENAADNAIQQYKQERGLV